MHKVPRVTTEQTQSKLNFQWESDEERKGIVHIPPITRDGIKEQRHYQHQSVQCAFKDDVEHDPFVENQYDLQDDIDRDSDEEDQYDLEDDLDSDPYEDDQYDLVDNTW